LDVEAEVQAMLPIVFPSLGDGQLLSWNDRCFASFVIDGRKGFGTVEFQALVPEPGLGSLT
jgi:hypothetical protein